jgi:lysosomal acid lipase/cholesteryl ester hydrolase
MSNKNDEMQLNECDAVRVLNPETHPVSTRDGLTLRLTRFRTAPCDRVVLLHHGLTTGSNMFTLPETVNLVRYLHDAGFTDVWTLDSRMSWELPYNRTVNRYTLDDVALYDHPAAVAVVRDVTGDLPLFAITHCLGSVSFLMSLAAGLLGPIAGVVPNSVSLAPRVPAWSRVKLTLAPPLIEHVLRTGTIAPTWGDLPWYTPAGLTARLTDLAHPECDVAACHMLSMMWGAGFPAMFRHENLAPATHHRLPELFGPTGMHYYRHVLAMVKAGRAVRMSRGPAYDDLPLDYLAAARGSRTPILYATGTENHVFTDSNVVAHRLLGGEIARFPGYGHQDVFFGDRAHRDVFPRIVAFLRQHTPAGAR